MQSVCAAIPEFAAPGSAIGLGWRLSRWGNRTIVGHDGDTIGQSAYLRIDPEAGIAACLLTNSAESETLYREVFSEVFGDLTGVTMPPPPRPADGVPGSGSGPEASEMVGMDGALVWRISSGTPVTTPGRRDGSTCRYATAGWRWS